MANKSTVRAALSTRILRLRDVLAFSGKRHTALKVDIAKGEFPKPVPLNDSGRSIGWLEEELLQWREGRIKAREAKKASRR
jgi:predicted DNA-binding transcriptional regulator AlpA